MWNIELDLGQGAVPYAAAARTDRARDTEETDCAEGAGAAGRFACFKNLKVPGGCSKVLGGCSKVLGFFYLGVYKETEDKWKEVINT